jgi:hypothetical protein
LVNLYPTWLLYNLFWIPTKVSHTHTHTHTRTHLLKALQGFSLDLVKTQNFLPNRAHNILHVLSLFSHQVALTQSSSYTDSSGLLPCIYLLCCLNFGSESTQLYT